MTNCQQQFTTICFLLCQHFAEPSEHKLFSCQCKIINCSFTKFYWAISISVFFSQWFNSLWQHFCYYTLKTASKILADSNIEWPHYNYLHQVYTKEYKGQDSLKTYSIYLSFLVNVFPYYIRTFITVLVSYFSIVLTNHRSSW